MVSAKAAPERRLVAEAARSSSVLLRSIEMQSLVHTTTGCAPAAAYMDCRTSYGK